MSAIDGLPVLNINGTAKEELLQAYADACVAIQDAMAAMGRLSPNGRDYQTAKPGQYDVARNRYCERFAFLDRLANELQDEAIAIDEQRR